MIKSIIMVLFLFPDIALASWTNPRQVTNSSGVATNACLAIDNSGLMCFFWDDDSSGREHVLVRISRDNGLSFGLSQDLTSSSVQARNPSVFSNNGIYLSWESEASPGKYQICWRKSCDNGLSWTSEQAISDPAENSLNPSITAGEAFVYAAWIDAQNSRTFFRSSSDSGKTWTDIQFLGNGQDEYPCVSVDSCGRVHAVFTEENLGSIKVIYRRSDDHGAGWSAPFIISGDSVSGKPSLITSGENIYVAWEQSSKIHFRQSLNHGASWLPEKCVSGNLSGSAFSVSMSADKTGKVYLSWIDNRDGINKVYLDRSVSGQDWPADEVISSMPALVITGVSCFGENIHIWFKSQNQFFCCYCDEIPPVVLSLNCSSHPGGASSGNNDPVFCWQAADNEGGSGIAGFNYVFDGQPGTIPENRICCSSLTGRIDWPGTPNGNWYFHVRPVDNAGNWGPAVHCRVIIENKSLLPLNQLWCQPNPVRNNAPKIHYFLRQAGLVKIEFFNEAGEKISEFEETGHTGINWFEKIDASRWANGVYFYRFSTADQSTGEKAEAVKAMVLIR